MKIMACMLALAGMEVCYTAKATTAPGEFGTALQAKVYETFRELGIPFWRGRNCS